MVISFQKSGSRKLQEKVNIFVWPASAATCQILATSPWNDQSTTPTMTTMPPMSTKNCMTSVHSTAFMPPRTVYRVVSPPTTATQAQTGQPTICCRASEIA